MLKIKAKVNQNWCALSKYLIVKVFLKQLDFFSLGSCQSRILYFLVAHINNDDVNRSFQLKKSEKLPFSKRT